MGVRPENSLAKIEFNVTAQMLVGNKTNGGPLRYRVTHEVALWRAGERPQMRLTVVEGDAGLSV